MRRSQVTQTAAEKGKRFQELHDGPGIFLMPNAWDAGSARILEDAGHPAIGTTSAGIVCAMGRPDYGGMIGRDEMLTACRAIAEAVDIPVSGDLEDGYGQTPEDAAETMRAAIDAGFAGGSLEDHPGPGGIPLADPEAMADRIRAAREAIDAAGQPFVLTARAECYLAGHGDPSRPGHGGGNAFGDSLARLKIYADAGADCIYAPGMTNADVIAANVQGTGAPVNVLVGIHDFPLSFERLEELGVRRLSIGGSLACAALGLVHRAAATMMEGNIDYFDGALGHSQLCDLFRREEAQ
jgi:2-methylisocitrate lyase-like PEP mutase family enzyme